MWCKLNLPCSDVFNKQIQATPRKLHRTIQTTKFFQNHLLNSYYMRNSSKDCCKCTSMIACQVVSVNAPNYHKNLHAWLKWNTSKPYNEKLRAQIKQNVFIECASEIVATMPTPSAQKNFVKYIHYHEDQLELFFLFNSET